jgi:hypothetical protein
VLLLLLLLLCLMLLLSGTAIAALQCHSSVELLPWLHKKDARSAATASDKQQKLKAQQQCC